MATVTLVFEDMGPGSLPLVGGKAANLGVLARAGIPVPRGFAVTTAAYARFLEALPDADARFAALDLLDGTDVEAARAAAGAMRAALDRLPFPDDLKGPIVHAWRALGDQHPLAVRSSATAEDLPGASFAGQQDTYLNVRGEDALLDAVRRCWISLFTDRAVLYRARGGFGHRAVRLAVVVQRLVDPDVSGILFTADPVSSHRHVASIDAGYGLGEALVGGLISADLYRVDRRARRVLEARVGGKEFAIRSTPGGGTRREELPEERRRARALSDGQVLALADVGGRIEALYGGEPQDVEWCLAGGEIHILQARPITSLFPIPRPFVDDGGLRVFLSFGHFQMMLDAMPTFALEVWRMFFPAGRPLETPPGRLPSLSATTAVAGGRLFLDATPALRVPLARRVALGALSHVYDALARSAAVLVERREFQAVRGGGSAVLSAKVRVIGPLLARLPLALFVQDPAEGARAFERALDEIPRAARARVDAVRDPSARIVQAATEIANAFVRVRTYLPRLLSGVVGHVLLRRLARGAWADAVRGEVDGLLRGLPGNVTTQMDLAVGDLTDLVRPHTELGALLRDHTGAGLPDALARVPGGEAFLTALDAFLARFGDRGAGEIDVSRPRWRDDPSLLLRVISGGLGSATGAHRRQHEAQVAAGEAAAARLVEAAGKGLDPVRAWLVRRLVRVARTGLGLREHPKFIIVKLLGMLRREALAAGEELERRGQLARADDVWHLGFSELAAALSDSTKDPRADVAARAAAFRHDRTRKPPLVISSEGEVPVPKVDLSGLPAGALPGTAASAGVVEGIARVVTDPAREVLHAGEILVAPFTDPGWTPLFVHAAGVVTEVGGLMTHGAVVAREYGIPAVVSVASAVEKIRTGMRIRVDGTRGYVQILEDPLTPAAS
jgi:phosphohistidine swiveling domain-containing protein